MPGSNNKWKRLGNTRRAAVPANPIWTEAGRKAMNKQNQANLETNLFNALKQANANRMRNLASNNGASRKRKNRSTRRNSRRN
jgi:hypothetical protein